LKSTCYFEDGLWLLSTMLLKVLANRQIPKNPVWKTFEPMRGTVGYRQPMKENQAATFSMV